MKNTIPFSSADILNNEQLVIDVSAIDMVQFNNSIRAIFIYLRNSGQAERILLDFSNCSFETKEKWMLEYILGDIDLNLRDLNTAWIKTMLVFLSATSIDVQSFLTEAEIQSLICQNRKTVQDLIAVCKSSLFWTAEYMAKSTGFQDFETFFTNSNNETELAPTFSNIISQNIDAIEFIALNDKSIPICDFKKCFTENQRHRLIQCLHNSSVVVMLFGSRTPQWNILTQLVSNLLSM